jgi:hypothetical protein
MAQHSLPLHGTTVASKAAAAVATSSSSERRRLDAGAAEEAAALLPEATSGACRFFPRGHGVATRGSPIQEDPLADDCREAALGGGHVCPDRSFGAPGSIG